MPKAKTEYAPIPFDTELEMAQNKLDHLKGWPESVFCYYNPDAAYIHLSILQHWMQKFYWIADDSIVENDDVGYRGVVLHRPRSWHPAGQLSA